MTLEQATGKTTGYMMAIAVSGLPYLVENATQTDIVFTITPYGITSDGETVFGAVVEYTLPEIVATAE